MAVATIGIIWLHGLGDTEQGWKEILTSAWNLSPLKVEWRFPRAPEQPVTANGGMTMTSWFDLSAIPVKPEQKEYPDTIAKSVSFVHDEIDELVKTKNIPAQQIFVGGFSQGGAITMQAGLTYRERLAGVICFSGWLLNEKTFKPGNETPLLWWHGTMDNVVVPELQTRGVKVLQDRGVSVEEKQSRMAHSSHPDQISFLPKWIREKVGAGGPVLAASRDEL